MKHYYLILDTETTIDNTVYDLGAIIVDSNGKIEAQLQCIIAEEAGKQLWYDKGAIDGIFALAGAEARKREYTKMLKDGRRVLCSKHAVNNTLLEWYHTYNSKSKKLFFTGYNVAFDIDKCNNTGIVLSQFMGDSTFDLWGAALGNICETKGYKQFILDNHHFRNRTEKGNMAYITNAETVAQYILQNGIVEPHTAIEDILYFELPILLHIIKKDKWRSKIKSYNWRNYQLNSNYMVK